MTFDEIRDIALSYPAVEEHTMFGSPAFKVRKRLLLTFAKIEPVDTLVLKVPSQLEREYLLTTKPEIYYMQEHYLNFECLLVRMSKIDSVEFHELFEDAWRTYAPKRVVANYKANSE